MDEVKAMSRAGSRAGETVGRAVGSGWLAVRKGAVRAGQASADATMKAAQAADRKLTERGVAPQQLTVALAEGAELARQEVVKTTRRTRKKLARTAKHTRKELAKAAKQANKDARKSKPAKRARKTAKQAKADAKKLQASLRTEAARMKARAKDEAVALKLMQAPKKRRRWPKVMLFAIVAAGVAYVARSKSTPPAATPLPEPRERAADSTTKKDTAGSTTAGPTAAGTPAAGSTKTESTTGPTVPNTAPGSPAGDSTSGNGQQNGRPSKESTTKHG